MPDASAELAAFLSSEGHRLDGQTLARTIKARWPGLTGAELERGFAIATETKRQDAAEHFAEADAMDALDIAVTEARSA